MSLIPPRDSIVSFTADRNAAQNHGRRKDETVVAGGVVGVAEPDPERLVRDRPADGELGKPEIADRSGARRVGGRPVVVEHRKGRRERSEIGERRRRDARRRDRRTRTLRRSPWPGRIARGRAARARARRTATTGRLRQPAARDQKREENGAAHLRPREREAREIVQPNPGRRAGAGGAEHGPGERLHLGRYGKEDGRRTQQPDLPELKRRWRLRPAPCRSTLAAQRQDAERQRLDRRLGAESRWPGPAR